MITVLVTATGTGIGQSIIKGLKLANKDYRIIGTDIKAWAAGIYRCHKGYLVPLANEKGYIQKIIDIIKSEKVDIVIPGCDPELPVLAEKKDLIEDETGAVVVVGSQQAVDIGRDKYKTYLFLKGSGFPYPKTGLPEEVELFFEDVGFPIVVKPRRGSGTRNVHVVFDESDLRRLLTPDCVLQEYLVPKEWGTGEVQKEDAYSSGILRQTDEYSTEVLVSKEGKLLGSITNWRTMKKGYPIRAIVDDYDEIRRPAEKIVLALKSKGLVGPCNLQCRNTERGPVFFEINPRFSGSTAVRCAAGFNGPDIIVRDFILDEDENDLRRDLKYKRLVEIRYWNEIYLSPEEFEKLKNEKHTNHAGVIYYYL